MIDFIPHETERFSTIRVECRTDGSQLLLDGDKNLEFNLSNCQETSIVYRCRSSVLLFLNLDARGLWTMKPTAPRGRLAPRRFSLLMSPLFTATARMESLIRQRGADREKLWPAAAAENVNKAEMKLSERKMPL